MVTASGYGGSVSSRAVAGLCGDQESTLLVTLEYNPMITDVQKSFSSKCFTAVCLWSLEMC